MYKKIISLMLVLALVVSTGITTRSYSDGTSEQPQYVEHKLLVIGTIMTYSDIGHKEKQKAVINGVETDVSLADCYMAPVIHGVTVQFINQVL